MGLINLLFFAIALNMDALGVGISYGIRRIKMPFSSILIISSISMGAIIISMTAGRVLVNKLPALATQRLGGIILVLIGLWAFYQYLRQEKKTEEEKSSPPSNETKAQPEALPLLKINCLGLIIHILRKPHQADLDMSGVITHGEAFLLGIALSMDAMAAGVALSLFGYSIILAAAFVGINYILLTYLGLYVGKGLSCSTVSRYIQIFPGIILVSLGLIKIGFF